MLLLKQYVPVFKSQKYFMNINIDVRIDCMQMITCIWQNVPTIFSVVVRLHDLQARFISKLLDSVYPWTSTPHAKHASVNGAVNSYKLNKSP